MKFRSKRKVKCKKLALFLKFEYYIFEYLLCGCARRMFQNKQITYKLTMLQSLAIIYF